MRWRAMAAGLAALGPCAAPAWAGQARAGLWDVTVTLRPVSTPGDGPAADLPQSLPEMRQRRCVRPGEVIGDWVGVPQTRGCAVIGRYTAGPTTTIDLVCHGRIEGAGRVTTTRWSDAGYTTEMAMQGTSALGRPVNLHQTIEGRWLGPDCGAAP